MDDSSFLILPMRALCVGAAWVGPNHTTMSADTARFNTAVETRSYHFLRVTACQTGFEVYVNT